MSVFKAAERRSKDDLPFLDIKSAEYLRDPFAAVSQARRSDRHGGRLLRSEHGIEIVDYELGRELLSDRRFLPPRADHFREMGAGPLLMTYLTEGKLTALDGARHLLRRKLLSEPLTPKVIEAARDDYRVLANGLVDRFVDRGSCDLVAEFAHSYPVQVLCHGLGIPQDDVGLFEAVTPEIALINTVPLVPVVPRIEAALSTLSEYTEQLLAGASRSTTPTFIHRLADHVEAGQMTRQEVVWSLVTLLQAAHYTTRNQIACIVRGLLETGTWGELVRDPTLIPAAVEEGMRYYPILFAVTRVVAAPNVVLDNVALPEGTVIRFNAIGAGRDPNRFEDADCFDLRRTITQRIPFGYGIHKCLGHTMARTDMEVALDVLTSRLVNPRLSAAISLEVSGALWGPSQLLLEFDRPA